MENTPQTALDYYISPNGFCQYFVQILRTKCFVPGGVLCEMFAMLFTNPSVLCILYKDSSAETLAGSGQKQLKQNERLLRF